MTRQTAAPSNHSNRVIQINIKLSRFDLPSQAQLPSVTCIHCGINNSVEIGEALNACFAKEANLASAHFPHKIPKLEYYVLCRARTISIKSSGVSKTTAKPTSFAYPTNFSMTVKPLFGCSCKIIASSWSVSRKRATLSRAPTSCPCTTKTFWFIIAVEANSASSMSGCGSAGKSSSSSLNPTIIPRRTAIDFALSSRTHSATK